MSRTVIEWLIVCATAFGVGMFLTPHVFALDDGYIALHSARVLLSGYDAVFRSPALTGVTSPAYVALLVALLRLGLSSGADALRFACVSGFVVYVTAIWAMAKHMPLATRIASTVLCVCSGLIIVNLTNGLETGWAMGLMAWLIVAVDRGAALRAAVLAGLIPFFRPDLAPAAALLLSLSISQQVWPVQAR